MKIKIYLMGLILLSGMNLLQARLSEPLVQEGRQWATRVWWAVAPPQLYTEIYRMEGDTVLDKKTYKKIYCYYTEDLSRRVLYHYALRQDGDKVYIKFYGEQGEKLFFDFSLKKGKTFSAYDRTLYDRTFKVESVYDTVLYPDSRARKAIRLKDRADESIVIWVDGIGSLNYGISWDGLSQLFGSKGYKIICCHQGDVQLYQNQEFDGCFVGEAPPGVAVETPRDNPAASWRLSPQPTRDRVRAVCEATEPGRRSGRWRIYDRTGKALQAGRFADGTFELSLAGYASGLYLVEIVSDNGTACRLKCIKIE